MQYRIWIERCNSTAHWSSSDQQVRENKINNKPSVERLRRLNKKTLKIRLRNCVNYAKWALRHKKKHIFYSWKIRKKSILHFFFWIPSVNLGSLAISSPTFFFDKKVSSTLKTPILTHNGDSNWPRNDQKRIFGQNSRFRTIVHWDNFHHEILEILSKNKEMTTIVSVKIYFRLRIGLVNFINSHLRLKTNIGRVVFSLNCLEFVQVYLLN